MNNWKYKLAAFMQGRYGIDPLNKAIPVIYLVFEAQGFLHAFNAVVVRAGEPVVLGADKYRADLDVSSRDRREGRLRRRWQGNHRQSEHQDE